MARFEVRRDGKLIDTITADHMTTMGNGKAVQFWTNDEQRVIGSAALDPGITVKQVE